MFLTLVSILLVLVSWHCKSSYPYGPVTRPCSVEFPEVCGEDRLISQETRPSDSYGPNVCVSKTVREAVTYSYVEKQVCFSETCWPPVCVPTGRCDAVSNITVTKMACCSGYTTLPSSSPQLRLSAIKTRGCPVAKNDLKGSLVECFHSLNLSDVYNFGSYRDVWESSSDYLTVFALQSNASRRRLYNASSNDANTVESTVPFLAINKVLPQTDLVHGSVYRSSASSVFAHITEVRFSTHSKVFINGVEIIKGDACIASNGIVHLISNFIPAGHGSIANIVSSWRELSTFKHLAEVAGLMQRLSSYSATTLFVPTNDAFPSDAIGCLKAQNVSTETIANIVSYHIARLTEYTHTLSLRDTVETLAPRVFLRVGAINGNVHVTYGRFPLLRANVPANNGVVHLIPRLITGDLEEKDATCLTAPSRSAPREGGASRHVDDVLIL